VITLHISTTIAFQHQYHCMSSILGTCNFRSQIGTVSLNSNANHNSDKDDIPSLTSSSLQRRKLLRNSMNILSSTLPFMIASSSYSIPADAAEKGTSGYIPDMVGGLKKPKGVGGLTKKIRKVVDIMDQLQRDLMQERWDLVEKYPDQLRSFVPVFTTYTDSAFPTDAPVDYGLRVALRYEVGRFFAAVVRLKQATSRRALDEAYIAYSDMALHFDRYLHIGGLYTYYDATITNEDYYKGVGLDSLVYADPEKDPALVRDLIVLVKGPDMGKTGIVIGIYSDGSGNCVVKLDRFMGLREIRVVPRSWTGKRLGEQDPDDVFLIS